MHISATILSSHLGCSVRTVQRLAKAGKLPHWKIGNKLAFDLAEVMQWTRVEADQKPRRYFKAVNASQAKMEPMPVPRGPLPNELVREAIRDSEGRSQKPLTHEERTALKFEVEISNASTGDQVKFLRFARDKELERAKKQDKHDRQEQERARHREQEPQAFKNPIL